MIKSITTTTGGMIHVITGEVDYGNPDAMNIITEMTTPVELNAEEADQLLQNISDVRNAMPA